MPETATDDRPDLALVGDEPDVERADDIPIEHEIARAEGEGLPPVPEPEPERPAVTIAQEELFAAQDRLDRDLIAVSHCQEAVKDAKKRAEGAQEDLVRAVRNLRRLLAEDRPDPVKFPLFDRKAEIDAEFTKFDVLPPPAPETFEAFWGHKSRHAGLDALGLKPAILKVLRADGLATVADIGRFAAGGSPLVHIRNAEGTITEKRAEDILAALAAYRFDLLNDWNMGVRP